MNLPALKDCPFCGNAARYDTAERSERVYCGSCGSYGCRDSLHFNIAIAGCSNCDARFQVEFGEDDKTTMEEVQKKAGERWNFRGRSCDSCLDPYTPKGPISAEEYGDNRLCDNCEAGVNARLPQLPVNEPAEWTTYLTDDELALATEDRRGLLQTISDLRRQLGQERR